MRTKRWRYSRWGESGEELYDHDSDPQEFTNLATDSDYESVLMRMRKLLKAKRQETSEFEVMLPLLFHNRSIKIPMMLEVMRITLNPLGPIHFF